MGIQGTRLGRRTWHVLISALAASAASSAGPMANAAEGQAATNAAVVRPNTLIKTEDLDFGTVASGATSGSVTINPVNNARSTAGGVTTVGTAGHRAIFQGTGGLLLIVVTGSNSVTLARSGGGAPSMTASLTRATTTSGGGVTLLGPSTTLLPSGIQTYYVGGTLTIPANQPEGEYSGTFTLTVNYL